MAGETAHPKFLQFVPAETLIRAAETRVSCNSTTNSRIIGLRLHPLSLLGKSRRLSRARPKFSIALEASLFKDDVPVAVYDGLIKAVREGISAVLSLFSS